MCPIMPFIIENDSSPGTYNYDFALENEFHEQYDDLGEAMHNCTNNNIPVLNVLI